MKIKTSKGSLLTLIPETEEERMLLEILSKKNIRIASCSWIDTKFSGLCLEFEGGKE